MENYISMTLAIFLYITGGHSSHNSEQCLGGMKHALENGKFTGPLVCEKNNYSFNMIGRTKGNEYTVYDYRYRYIPKNGNIAHGGQKVVIFRKNIYVGQYNLTPPPYAIMAMNGSELMIKFPDSERGVKVDLSTNLPSKIFADGETVTLYR